MVNFINLYNTFGLMLRQKLSPFGLKNSLHKFVTTAFLSSIAYMTTTKIKLDASNKKYDQ